MAPRYSCVNAAALTQLGRLAQAYKRMATPPVLDAAAMKVGEHLRSDMQKRIQREPSLSDYHDVADALQVHQDHRGNWLVGVPAEHPLAAKAEKMHGIYQLTDVTRDLESQSNVAQRMFYDELHKELP
jgi:hypothetical protein